MIIIKKLLSTRLMTQSLLAGALYPLACAPYSLRPCALASLLWWLWLLGKSTSWRQSFKLGLLFGLGQYLIGVSWIAVSIKQYGNADYFTTIIITLLFVASLSLFKALVGALSYYNRFKSHFAGFFLLSELLQNAVGFPWLLLGSTLLDTPLSPYLPLLGVFAASWLIATLALTIYHKRYKLALIIMVGAFLVPKTRLEFGTPVEVTIVQANLAPIVKFGQESPEQVLKRYYVAPSLASTSSLIIWPENSVNVAFQDQAMIIAKLDTLFKRQHKTVLFGTQSELAQGYYNTLRMIGMNQGIYHKQHLVPFGEYIPFHWLREIIDVLALPLADFKAGPKNQAALQWQGYKLLPLICYEISFPFFVAAQVQDSDFIINISEDGWFGASWGPKQHLEIARVRALEAQKYIIRAATTGISAIIDHKGQIVAETKQFTEATLTARVYPTRGTSFSHSFGLHNILLLIFFGHLLFFLASKKLRR